MSSSTGSVLSVLSNGNQFEFSQGHLPKVKPCYYRDTCGQQGIMCPLGTSGDARKLARTPKVKS